MTMNELKKISEGVESERQFLEEKYGGTFRYVVDTDGVQFHYDGNMKNGLTLPPVTVHFDFTDIRKAGVNAVPFMICWLASGKNVK